MNVILVNSGGVNPLRRDELQSLVDFTFVSDALVQELQYTHSEHQATIFQTWHRSNKKLTSRTTMRCIANEFDADMMKKVLLEDTLLSGST